MNEMVQLTSGLWPFEFSRVLSAATLKFLQLTTPDRGDHSLLFKKRDLKGFMGMTVSLDVFEDFSRLF